MKLTANVLTEEARDLIATALDSLACDYSGETAAGLDRLAELFRSEFVCFSVVSLDDGAE